MNELRELARRLVAMESINPGLQPGVRGELEIAGFVAQWLRNAGVETVLQDAAPGRPNAIGIVRGRGGGHSLMLNAHMDTVSFGGILDPPGALIDGSRFYGRGAWDMKGSLAAMMLVARKLAADPPNGDVLITVVVDEFQHRHGSRRARLPGRRGDRHRADSAGPGSRPQGLLLD